jgi:uncharacterized membrane protein YoaK (UPF0700 family)
MSSFWKWFFLAYACGSVNTGGYMAVLRFVSHVTGFSTLLGLDLGKHEWFGAFEMFTVPLCFMLGCAISGWMVDGRIQRGLAPRYSVPLLLAAALLVYAALGGAAGWFGIFGEGIVLKRDFWLMASLCMSCGLQNAVVTMGSGSLMRASHTTGPATDISTGLVRATLHPRGSIERRLETRLAAMRAACFAAFVVGAITGAYVYGRWQYLGFLLPAAIVLTVAGYIQMVEHRPRPA